LIRQIRPDFWYLSPTAARLHLFEVNTFFFRYLPDHLYLQLSLAAILQWTAHVGQDPDSPLPPVTNAAVPFSFMVYIPPFLVLKTSHINLLS
jgi:hypothetical protein